jgi:hypothetical protein
MYKGLSKKDARIAKHYESITDKKIKEEQRWAEENGLVVKGPIGISQAVATLKDRRKRMVSMRLDLENIEGMKEGPGLRVSHTRRSLILSCIGSLTETLFQRIL